MEPASLLSAAATMLLAGLNLDRNLNLTSAVGDPPADPAIYKTTPDLCREAGVSCSPHTVQTEDGYMLTAHHVPVPQGVRRRGALLAISGLVGCSDSFFLYLPVNMPQALASAGYDVVLGSLRGSVYSRAHQRWSPSQQRFWRYTLDDVGEHDLEALLSLTRRVTGEPRPFYLGYSTGASMLYTWLHRRPSASHALRGIILWGPSVFYAEPHSPVVAMYHLLPQAVLRALWLSPGDVLPRARMAADLAWPVCRPGARLRPLCEEIFRSIVGFPLDAHILSRLHEIVALTSCGLASSTFAHYIQNVQAKRLQAFDFGREENLRRYGSGRPPAYSMHNWTLPTAFFLGTRDRIVSFEEAERQIRMIPSSVKKMVVPIEGYDHLHFIFDKNLHRLVFERMISFMSEL